VPEFGQQEGKSRALDQWTDSDQFTIHLVSRISAIRRGESYKERRVTEPHMSGPDRDDDGQTGVVTKTRTRTQRPPLYKVLMLNDDYTPMEFVVYVLERIFGISNQQAVDIMLTVHNKGLAVVGVFSYEIAETKVGQVMELARRNQHPLQCTMEKE
jgi:ATP-dependent Clp protease adaptor protein ClpS